MNNKLNILQETITRCLDDLYGMIREWEITKFETFHPRAVKLLRREQNFLVVADDEMYFEDVYRMIRTDQINKGKWTKKDERKFQEYFPSSIHLDWEEE